MRMSETIAKIAAALAKFNAKIGKIEKDGTNPFLKNKYATLDNIVDAVRPLLAEQGISVIQVPSDGENGTILMRTILIHESGEFMESETLSMKPIKNAPQEIGSVLTYARRYQLSSFLSLNTGEDDDGNSSSGVDGEKKKQPDKKPQQKKNYPPKQDKPKEGPKEDVISADDLKAVNTLMSNYITANLKTGETVDGNRAKLKDWLRGKVGAFENVQFMTVKQGNQAKSALKQLINKQGKGDK
jgi:hypothetical protein